MCFIVFSNRTIYFVGSGFYNSFSQVFCINGSFTLLAPSIYPYLDRVNKTINISKDFRCGSGSL